MCFLSGCDKVFRSYQTLSHHFKLKHMSTQDSMPGPLTIIPTSTSNTHTDLSIEQSLRQDEVSSKEEYKKPVTAQSAQEGQVNYRRLNV